MHEAEGHNAWQSSHIGGHRYAPNVLFLPHSINYGLLSPEQVALAAETYRQGLIYDLDHYRGRTTDSPVVQAAEYFLRRATGNLRIADLVFQSAEQVADDQWQVSFAELSQGRQHQITLAREMTEESFLVSCSPMAQKAVPRYSLIDHQQA